MEFEAFNRHGYPTVDARTGYGEWVDHYEDSVESAMDLRLLEQLDVEWRDDVLDLACGTGRVGTWITERPGEREIDGVDVTPEMLDRAKARGCYRSLKVGDVRDTGFASGAYDCLVQSLADEHLPELGPLYAEAARLARPGAKLVIVGFHPHFLMLGVQTHFHRADGSAVGIESTVHLTSDHFRAGREHGWELEDFREGVVDDEWIAAKPKWAKYRQHPVSFAYVWTSPT